MSTFRAFRLAAIAGLAIASLGLGQDEASAQWEPTDTITLDVKEGMLAIFPAWLQHSVHPNMSNETRISVAFNIMFPEFGTAMAGPLWEGDAGTGEERSA